jgi:protein-S-isoprenylcysteine O-methyltransferase Ste14
MTLLTLITGTGIIVAFSWFYSIKHHRYHGIPRFFSFESVFILGALNLGIWFDDPFSPLNILSWILLLGSAWSGIAGYLTLSKKGRPGKNIEETTQLVKTGIYGLIRHPLYLSLLLLVPALC